MKNNSSKSSGIRNIILIKDAALKLGMTEQTLLNWRSLGLPIIKIGKFIFVSLNSLAKWMMDQEDKGRSDNFQIINEKILMPHVSIPKNIEFLKSPRAYANVFGKFGCFNPECKSGVELEVHHIKPKGKGGKDNFENYIVLCKKCHRGLNNHSDYENRQIVLRTYKAFLESKYFINEKPSQDVQDAPGGDL